MWLMSKARAINKEWKVEFTFLFKEWKNKGGGLMLMPLVRPNKVYGATNHAEWGEKTPDHGTQTGSQINDVTFQINSNIVMSRA